MTTRDEAITLANKHIVVVGGSSGMGLAVAMKAAAAGARVTLLARDQEKLRAAAKQVPNAHARPMDLRKSDSIPPVAADLGTVDHLVVTAGTYHPVPLAESGPEDWRGKLEERLVGPLLLIKLLAPKLTTSIVLFSGTVSRRPHVGVAMSAAAAAGVESMARALALELSPIRVNSIVPGMVDTPMLDAVLAENKRQVTSQMAQRLPAKCIGSADDAAQAAVFLMTNPFISGASIVLDGGGLLI